MVVAALMPLRLATTVASVVALSIKLVALLVRLEQDRRCREVARPRRPSRIEILTSEHVRPLLLHQQSQTLARCGVVVEAWGAVDRAGGGDVFTHSSGLL
jgi:hypothetical protein